MDDTYQLELPIGIFEDLYQAAPLNKRRKHPRYCANIPTRCFLADSRAIDVMIVDISEGGFGLSCALPVDRGDIVDIAIPGIGTFRATSVWKSERRCGLQLLPGEGHISENASDTLALMLSKLEIQRNQA